MTQLVPQTSLPINDLYDEEFNRNLMLAKTFVAQLRRKQDRDICMKWITRLCDMKSADPMVKKNRNQFFKYMLTVLHRGVNEAPLAHYGYPQYDDRFGAVGQAVRGHDYMSRWSVDRRTYVAVKPLRGRGALVYMAVSNKPELGWEYRK